MTDKMTESEKQENPSYAKTGGFLKSYAYKEAFQKSYNEASREDQLKVERLPNFNADKFFQISGIDVKAKVEELTMEQICNELGREIKIKK